MACQHVSLEMTGVSVVDETYVVEW